MHKKTLVFLFITASVNLFSQSLISIDLKANKLMFDAKRNKIYATVNGLDVAHGNSLVMINPVTGAIEQSLPIGSEPTIMALTKDTNFLYVALDGASFIKRVKLKNFTIDKSIALGANSYGALFAQDIATVKLSPDLIVVAKKNKSISPTHAGVAAYFKGTKLPQETPGHTGSNAIESANDTNFVIGFNTESTEYGIRKMAIDSVHGVALLSTTPNMWMGRDIKFHNGLIYSSNGVVLDPFAEPPVVMGSCQLGSNGEYYAVAPDITTNMIYFCSAEPRLTIRYHKLSTYSFVNDSIFVNAFPTTFQLAESVDMVRYNQTGIGVIVRENYFNDQDRRVILMSLVTDVGIEEYKNTYQKISMRPNPTNATLYIDCKDMVSIELNDAIGNCVYTQRVNHETELTLDLKTLGITPGIYLVKARNKQNVPVFGKVVYTN